MGRLGSTEKSFRSGISLTGLIVGILLTTHGVLLGVSIPQNAITFDESMHLPAGMFIVTHGEFWPYHHNPPLVKMLTALPAVLMDAQVDFSNYRFTPGNRSGDFAVGRSLMLLNPERYLLIFSVCRSVVALLSVIGAYFAYRWSREMFGDIGGLITLSLWTFGPNMLAHGGVVTQDVGATVFGLLATYAFWRYLVHPSAKQAAWSGAFLGLALASKFTLLVLPVTWLLAAPIGRVAQRNAQRYPGGTPLIMHGILLGLIALFVLNNVFLFEGTGFRLRDFEFRSKLLTVPNANPNAAYPRNRFHDSLLGNLPVPLPMHYVLGFDDQMYDIDTVAFDNYLRKETRRGSGWWYYYLYALLVKTPLGTLSLVAVSIFAFAISPGYRRDVGSESLLVLPILIVLISVSAQTRMNSHMRYILPIAPFVFVFAGRLGQHISADRWWLGVPIAVALGCTALSTLRVHPHYLTYFNEAAGGPQNGPAHLSGSNHDWGQGLLALAKWYQDHAPDRELCLIYYGMLYPEMLGIKYHLPRPDGPQPGLMAVCASSLTGASYVVHSQNGEDQHIPRDAVSYLRRFTPIAIPGNSIYVYELSLADVNEVRREMGRLEFVE